MNGTDPEVTALDDVSDDEVLRLWQAACERLAAAQAQARAVGVEVHRLAYVMHHRNISPPLRAS